MKFQIFRKAVVLTLGLWMLVASWSSSDSNRVVHAGVIDSYRSDQVVVKLDPVAGATIAEINATYSTTTLKPLACLNGVYLLQTPAGQDAQSLADAMAGDLRLAYAEANFIDEAPEANPSRIGGWGGTDPAPYLKQSALDQLNLARAHVLSRGAGIVVAILDTGVQLDHPALADHLTATRYDFVAGDKTPEDEFNGLDDDGDGLVDEGAGHGTHVAGIVHLVAPDARIMPLRVLDSEGMGDIFTVAEAIGFAVDNGAHVINASLGTPSRSNLLKDAVRDATRAGAVVVAAAGNLNQDAPQFPGATSCSFAVTSVDAANVKSAFANFGAWVDFAAPGESIYSAFPPSGYARWSGTSMAAPFVAGQAALLRSISSSLNARTTAALISGTARALNAANPKLVGRMGVGLPDVGASVETLAAGTIPDNGRNFINGSCIQ
ncbi:MAG: S8 family serine peptidase [Chloroflexi bacterium]|nr:S8 family serine peptidase [Chloroflexota bacterium]